MSNIKREILIMRRLSHTNIVTLFEVLASKSKIYFVMEFVKGEELFARIANKGRLTEDLSQKVFQQLISAVSYCHSRGVYHRDLKPDNILLDENGDVKVRDFGLSALKEQIQSDGLLHTLCGTPAYAYVAPEILSKKGYDGAKIDVWSCGIILFVLCAGYLRFNDPNLMVMYKKIYKGEFRCPKGMYSELKGFLSRILDVDPMTRITIDEIKRDPWFNKGFKDVKSYDGDFGGKLKENVSFNAFDLIYFSSGLDLSGLFEDTCNSVNDLERVVVENSLKRIMENIVEKVKEERDGNVVLMKMKEWGVELKGQNGKFCISLEVYQLTKNLIIMEAKRLRGEDVYFNELWTNKIKPGILNEKENFD